MIASVADLRGTDHSNQDAPAVEAPTADFGANNPAVPSVRREIPAAPRSAQNQDYRPPGVEPEPDEEATPTEQSDDNGDANADADDGGSAMSNGDNDATDDRAQDQDQQDQDQ